MSQWIRFAALGWFRGGCSDEEDFVGGDRCGDSWRFTSTNWSMPPEENGGATPAYHKDARGAKFPDTLSPDLFVGNPAARRAYTVAATIKPYLYQQPCYCYCDRGYGHKSLLDCFVDKHGSVCGTCQQEALYTYQQLKNGKTPAQIREGIMRGDWKRLALAE